MLAKFMDLPTELILQILQDDVILSADLYAVGVASKRLNLIAIPLLLETQGVANPEDSISLSLDHNSLHPSQLYPGLSRLNNKREKKVPLEAAIMVAFHVSSIREVKCKFPQSFTDLRILLHHLERLSGLISRLKSVKSMTFHFIGDHRYRHLSLNPLSANPVPFADIFGDIIQTLTSKGCEELLLYNKSYRLQGQLVLGVGPDEPTFPFASPSVNLPDISRSTEKEVAASLAEDAGVGPSINRRTISTSKTQGTKGILGWAWAKFGCLPQFDGTTSLASKPSSSVSPRDANLLYPSFDPSVIEHRGTLRDLHIQTPFALLPRCLPAIRHIIHSSASTLTSLTFSYIVFDQHLFDSCLSSLFLNQPNAITHLSILHCRHISPKAFMGFLSCFQGHLEYLELDREMSVVTGTKELPRILYFPELRTLKAPLDWVAYLVRTPLPNLSTMTIQCRIATAEYFNYEVFLPLLDSVLEPLYLRRKAYSSIPDMDITLDLKLDRNRPWQTDQDIDISREERFPSTPSLPVHWHLISKLALSSPNPPASPSEALAMAQWMRTFFPAVEQVTLPFPYIASLMTIPEYKSRQKEIADDSVAFLRLALRYISRDSADAPPLAWKKFVVGQWRFSFDSDPGLAKCTDPTRLY